MPSRDNTGRDTNRRETSGRNIPFGRSQQADAADVGFESDEQQFTVRAVIERVLHGVAIALILFAIYHAISALRQEPTVYASGNDVRSSMIEWSTRQSPSMAHVALDSVPTPDLRDWLAAFPGASTKMTWEGVSLRPSAVSVEPVADPKRPARIWVAAPDSAVVTVGDELGVIDSLFATSGGGVLTVPGVTGNVTSLVSGTLASSVVRDSLTVKPVLLLSVASWEGKFVMSALEEHGWKVDGRFLLSPKVGDVPQNISENPVIDTTRYSAVIVLDTAGQRYAGQIERYVRNGGGFIASGPGAMVPAFASLLPGTATGRPSEEVEFALDSARPRNALALVPLSNLKPGAVPIERRGEQVAVAARRLGDGRVLQVAYLDTWRWRMGGVEQDPVDKHRHWWTTMVSSIAYAPRFPLATANNEVEPTPMASLVSILGTPSSQEPPSYNILNDPRLLPVLFGILMAVFLVEWASRRLRGQP